MRYSGSLVKKEREEIFKLFLNKEKLKFNEIEKALRIRSNMVAYHLEKMQEESLLEKKEEHYSLTKKAEKYIPIFPHVVGEELSPLPVVLVALMNNNKILLIKRNKRPYKDYWSMIGGKIKFEESFKEASLRIVKEKAVLNGTFKSINSVFHERVTDKEMIKHSFILFFTKVETEELDFKETEHGRLQWFKMDKIEKEKIIPSDTWLIKNKLGSKINLQSAFMNEKEGELKSFRLT